MLATLNRLVSILHCVFAGHVNGPWAQAEADQPFDTYNPGWNQFCARCGWLTRWQRHAPTRDREGHLPQIITGRGP